MTKKWSLDKAADNPTPQKLVLPVEVSVYIPFPMTNPLTRNMNQQNLSYAPPPHNYDFMRGGGGGG